MKKVNNLRSILLSSTFIAASMVFTLTACNDKNKTPDTEKVAEDQNEAKFEDTQKEDDADFLVEAAAFNMEQVEAGKLVQKSANADTKATGKMMEEDHQKAWKELEALAAKKQITLPAGLTDDSKKDFEDLNKKTGADFDRAYASWLVSSHKDAISKYEDAAKNSKDSEVVAWANAQLDVLKAHLAKAEAWKDKIK
ncbi:DUF4142 domain-containing protein [Flavobacterium kingsejongi]|uniref:DUF4142 domain-containing protein n=1 Tax=Flavobacterium kingsejongi TaxID=1678728 RepID=A0A2S1LTF1_9FLAO|nr:DUF4142 domain-containing protein [Flavobacterium kingsejongi]AWG27030.1 hypothetical protein FK004_18225 [Flavobacterium kingsejongi]